MVAIDEKTDSLHLPPLPGAVGTAGYAPNGSASARGCRSPNQRGLKISAGCFPSPGAPASTTHSGWIQMHLERAKRPTPSLEACGSLVEVEIEQLHNRLQTVHTKHVQNADRRATRAERQKRKELEKHVQMALRGRQEQLAILIQSHWRRHWVQTRVLPLKIEEKVAQELVKDRAELAQTLHSMRGVVHDLNYVENDRMRAIIFIQGWWRGVTSRRAMKILNFCGSLSRIQRKMVSSAIKMQTRWRTYAARNLLLRMRQHRDEEAASAQRAKDAEERRQIIVVQSAVRCYLAMKEAKRRRIAREKAAQEEASPFPDSPTEQNQRRRTRKQSKEGKRRSSSNLGEDDGDSPG